MITMMKAHSKCKTTVLVLDNKSKITFLCVMMFLNLTLIDCTSYPHCIVLFLSYYDLNQYFVFSLIHSIVNRIIKLGNSQSSFALAPALVETYSRLLVYMEIESLGIKGFISKTIYSVCHLSFPFLLSLMH